MAEITLKQAQEQVDSWIKTYGVRYFNELTNMTPVTIWIDSQNKE